MRIDMEQFLALTVALGAAGAIGVGVYSARSGDETPPASSPAEEVEAEPEADVPPPQPVLVPVPVPTVAEVPPSEPVEAEPDEGADVPGPDVEIPNW